ncbi:MAG: NTP transferase domain-containing protein, partial [Flavobacteriales bacterium]|nr:NTP transferase domain-containing protein [Flavobacteriales bacterium]
VMNKKVVYTEKINVEKTIRTIDIEQIKLLPVVDDKGILLDVINLLSYKITLPIEAFIMAGGEGQRLRPLTANTPKPLLMVGDKPIIEHNIDRLKAKGIGKVYISLKYLGEQLKEYFGNGDVKKLEISYVEESKALGTIGAVSLVDEFGEDTILVMNSDLLTNFDLDEMYHEFVRQDVDMMVATIPYKVSIPYAVMELKSDRVTSFKEKPTYTYQSNAGIYLFKKNTVGLIPKNQHFNATDLMEKMIAMGKSIGYYPILGYWLDIGKHEDYEKAQEDIKHLKL